VTGAIAVAIGGVEPSTFERCALIRDWLDDIGVKRVTLLVIPAPQLHPFATAPRARGLLLDRVDAGDAVAQHGLQHRRTRARPLRRVTGWTCTRPTSTTRATSTRWSASCCAPAIARPPPTTTCFARHSPG
jgi:uncharacterized protein